MLIKTLGTNGWFDTEFARTMCTLLKSDDFSVILDAGSGFPKIRNEIDFTKPVYLLLSHLHLDHLSGLHTLEMMPFTSPLKIIVPAGQKEAFKAIGRPPYSANWLSGIPGGAELYDTDEIAAAGLPFKLSALELCHPVPTCGYRLELEGKVIAYLCDTGYCANAVCLAKNADFVIAECGALPGKAVEHGPHMDPAFCARLAAESHAKRMLLTHFSALLYPAVEDRFNAVEPIREANPHIIPAVDNIEVKL